jgi:glycosyltransferase involved in cell wall biosynthesis
MRVLVVHNRYSSRVPSGENLAVDDEVRWLRDAGVEVETHEVTNDEVFGGGTLERARQGVESLWSASAHRRVATAIDQVDPDLVHIHNLFPLLSASVPWTATRRRRPVVWTVHNHRIACVIGTNFRDGEPCHLCRPGWRLPGIRHACYGGSALASGLITGATSVFGRIARRHLTAVAISRTVGTWLTDTAAFPADRVRVKYNAVAGPPDASASLPAAASRRVILFAGYLADYKGVSLLLEAWRRADMPAETELRLVGDGPRADEVRDATLADPRIVWTGNVPASEVPAHLAAARVVVVPSTWEEPFGRSAAEALAYGRPVVTTGSGGLGEIVDPESGWITGTDPDDLAKALVDAATSDGDVARRAEAAVRRHRQLFAPEVTTRELIRIYEDELDRAG